MGIFDLLDGNKLLDGLTVCFSFPIPLSWLTSLSQYDILEKVKLNLESAYQTLRGMRDGGKV